MSDPISASRSAQITAPRPVSGISPIGQDSALPQRESPQPSAGILVPEDSVVLSRDARALAERAGPGDDHDHAGNTGQNEQDAEEQVFGADAAGTSSSTIDDQELTDEEKQEVAELRDRDREVRAHENAHKVAAGSLAQGGPVYEYQTGPDGRRYAVGGHVDIAVGGGNTPEERLRNAKQAQRAAQAPADPSGQDRAVAAKAAQDAREAQAEIAQERLDEAAGEGEGTESTGIPSANEASTGAEAEDERGDGASGTANDSTGIYAEALDAYAAATATPQSILDGLIA